MPKWIFLLFIGIAGPLFAIYPPPVTSKKGMVVSEQALASEVGADILRQGGNAIDAAVAVGYALAVTQPCCGNIGGGGFMLIHLASGKTTFINFREKAPKAAFPAMYLPSKGKDSLKGYSAVAVPGTVLGFETALEKYGSLPRKVVMAPAIRLAKEGFIVSRADANRLAKRIKDFPSQKNVAAIFLQNGHSYAQNQRLLQKQLAGSLELIAKEGAKAFYQGSIAQKIVKASQANNGYLTLEDFANYTVQELPPLVCQYKGYTIETAPPPSAGGVTLCEALGILEGFDLQTLGYHSAASVHYIVEALRYAFADRNNKLGDPDFVTNPIQKLLSKAYLAAIRSNIQPFSATPSSILPAEPVFYESSDTTHYSVADKEGNLVSVTTTLNGYYGAHVIASDTGFFLNNQMNDFAVIPGQANQFGLVESTVNQVASGKRPLSSMTPTMVFFQQKPLLVLGSPGGPRIISAVLQTLLNVIDYKMDIKTAVDEPRLHHQWLPDVIDLEPFTLSADTIKQLSMLGYRFRLIQPATMVEAIAIEAAGFLGASDDREPAGAAVGVETLPLS